MVIINLTNACPPYGSSYWGCSCGATALVQTRNTPNKPNQTIWVMLYCHVYLPTHILPP
eukprot:NODE_2895_length_627_cov_41.299308_g2412_i0.p3 GENE.NODE_2895_length_627_cov_41.299308_g2412_i0~~NODE_2895_length_627_cov_41.299308_g2412_i0.p3  ORF type:complete len:59 (+),score=9.99 NODE_2895_length_627_cov_41.299308_g2412_i0:300-476(+)